MTDTLEYRQNDAMRGFDMIACAPGGRFGHGAPDDADMVAAIRDLIALQRWRQDRGLSVLTPHRVIALAVVAARVDVTHRQCPSCGRSLDGELAVDDCPENFHAHNSREA